MTWVECSTCGERMSYMPKPIVVFRGAGSVEKPEGPRTVYLTCSRGHTHAYTVGG